VVVLVLVQSNKESLNGNNSVPIRPSRRKP